MSPTFEEFVQELRRGLPSCDLVRGVGVFGGLYACYKMGYLAALEKVSKAMRQQNDTNP